jgi:hypothetical protein
MRSVETALGDGVKRVYESELASLKKLRRVVPVSEDFLSATGS